jgi:hypothetical protein
LGYKPAVAHYGSELSSILLANFENATIDKTLFYDIKGVKACVMTSHEASIEFKNSVTIGFTNSG